MQLLLVLFLLAGLQISGYIEGNCKRHDGIE